jgi:ribosomal protein L40E
MASRTNSVNRCPTEKQYSSLRILGGGARGLSWGVRDTEQLLRRGWVTAERDEGSRYYQWVTITPEGLRALAVAVERYGWPEIKNPTLEQKVCSDCGAAPFEPRCRKCGGRYYHWESKPAEEAMAA